MKRLTLLLAFVAMVGMVSAQDCCGTKKSCCGATKCQDSKQTQAMKTLVTYFSASGVTRGAAKELAGIIGADLYEITPEKLYTDADLDWRDKNSRSSVEMQDKSSRPALKDGGKVDLSKYDVVYVGFPIWWYTAPTIINTFIEANDFTGKTIVPFATSGGSTIKKACEDLQAAYPKYKFGEGKLLNKINKSEIEKWAGAVK